MVTLTPCVALLLCCVLAACSALPIAEIYYAQYYETYGECDNDALVRPRTWLLTSGITTLCFLGTVITLLMCVLANMPIALWVGLVIVLILHMLFSTAWTVIGAVVLWRDNLSCAPQGFHDLFWASVIIQLIGFVLSCVGGKQQSASSSQRDERNGGALSFNIVVRP